MHEDRDLKTDVHILQSYIKKYSKWIETSLPDALTSVVIKRKFGVFNLRVENFQTLFIRVPPTKLFTDNDNYYYIQVPKLDADIAGVWACKLLWQKRGNFTFQIRNMTITVGKIMPLHYYGLPFIHPIVNCTLDFEQFRSTISKSVLCHRVLSTFLNKLVHLEVENIISHVVVETFNSFLMHGIRQISMRHLLPTGSVLNNMMVKKPEVISGGNVVTYHAGLLEDENYDSDLQKNTFSNLQFPARGDIIYGISIRMVSEVIRAAYSHSAFEWNFASDGYQLRARCTEVPKVSVSRNYIELKLKQNYQFSNRSFYMHWDVHEFIFFLKVHYSHSPRLHLQVVNSSAWTWNFSNPEVEVRFVSKVQRRIASLVSNQLLIPLPMIRNVIARDGAITFLNDYILFVSFVSLV
ncbi:unnamed protein product [Thelazia callipaeda]|uniref:BPI2 domain-containing protein n=1 Tax=Thelazia callipaeda TaxID=103827 RepID=A0A0N5D730_THECL|nr:unnamed protein product [Thelazia callipaeda]